MVAYLVDGNNVMGQRVGWHKDKVGARRRLIDELARFTRSEGVPVEVVFDGAPDEHFPEGSTAMGVRVSYAARGSDADTRIKHLVERSPERHSLVVVTSDREAGRPCRPSRRAGHPLGRIPPPTRGPRARAGAAEG